MSKSKNSVTNAQNQGLWVNLKAKLTPKLPLLKIIGIFCLVIIAFYSFWVTDFFKENILEPWTSFNALIAAKLLGVFGYRTEATGFTLSSPQFSISIKEGCDALEPLALFLAGIIAYSTGIRNKLIGFAAGTGVLLFVNFIRIISLFLIGIYWEAAFEFFHIEFWQVVFILLAVSLLVLWIRWSDKKRKVTS